MQAGNVDGCVYVEPQKKYTQAKAASVPRGEAAMRAALAGVCEVGEVKVISLC